MPMDLSLIDGLILLALAAGLVRGFMMGAVQQVTSLVGFGIAFVVAIEWMEPLGGHLEAYLSLSDDVTPLVAFVLLFAAVQLAVAALTRAIEQVLDALSLGLLNRAAGSLLGAFKASLFLSVLFLVLASANLPDEETRSDSRFYSHVAPMLPNTWQVATRTFPGLERISERFGDHIEDHMNGRDGPDVDV